MRRKFLALALTFAMCAAMSAETAHATSPATTSELPDGLESSVPVIVVGNYKFTSQFTAENDDQATTKASNTSVDYDDMITYVDSLSALPSRYAKSSDDAAAIVISQDVVDEYTSDGSGKTALEALLNTGNVAYFPETSYDEMSHIFGAITGDGFNMTPVEEGNSDQVTAYVLKDIKGNYYTGNIIAPDNAAQEAIDERILVETQENHSIYTTGRSMNIGGFSGSLTMYNMRVIALANKMASYCAIIGLRKPPPRLLARFRSALIKTVSLILL